jgi:hypothetical protein
MPEIAADSAGTVSPKGLFGRALGVVLSPKDTYADVAIRPGIVPALCLVLVIVVSAATIFSSSQVGRELTLEQAVKSMETFGIQVSDQMYTQMESRIMNQRAYGPAIGTAVIFPVLGAIVAGIVFAVFTPLMGGDAKYSQVFAVVVHSGILIALQTLFIYPMFYLKQSMASPTSLAVFLPFLDETSFVGRLIGAFDLFRLWWIVNLAIGVGVLYRRKTASIVWSMLAVYAVIALIIAGVGVALSGA